MGCCDMWPVNVSQETGRLASLTLTPYPPQLPGNLTMSASIRLFRPLIGNIRVVLDIRCKVGILGYWFLASRTSAHGKWFNWPQKSNNKTTPKVEYLLCCNVVLLVTDCLVLNFKKINGVAHTTRQERRRSRTGDFSARVSRSTEAPRANDLDDSSMRC